MNIIVCFRKEPNFQSFEPSQLSSFNLDKHDLINEPIKSFVVGIGGVFAAADNLLLIISATIPTMGMASPSAAVFTLQISRTLDLQLFNTVSTNYRLT